MRHRYSSLDANIFARSLARSPTARDAVSLDTEDLLSHKHLSPWLVCVYTEEHYRGRGALPFPPLHSHRSCVDSLSTRACVHVIPGLMGELLKRVLDKAREVGLSQVWLWTKDLTVPLYEKYGWVKKEGLVYQGYPISIMQVQLHSAPSTAQ
jgi:GNAT superfamily N-acetyltransferase